jgi:chitinase
LIVSAFGETDHPTGADPVALAGKLAAFVKDNKLDGVDVDYEDLAAMDAKDGHAEQWLINFTKALRDKLPSKDYILTHAPLAPWYVREYKKFQIACLYCYLQVLSCGLPGRLHQSQE